MTTSDSGEINRTMWDERAAAHAASPDYAFDRFASDPEFLSRVVRLDRPLLGEVSGLRGAHLQCHIGTDTVSLARLGARMTGLDFSGASLAQARRLASSAGADVDFVEAEVYDAVEALGAARFDLLYTGMGALCWLPSIERWADVVAALLAPGGRLFVREGHPMLWALQDRQADGLVLVEYPYFERPEPLVFEEDGTYVQSDASFEHKVSHSWNHGLGETLTALLSRGLRITGLAEHQSVPWEAIEGQMDFDEESGEYALSDRPWRVAHSYTLQAVKDA